MSFLSTFFGIRKKERKNKGKLDRTDLRGMILPPKERFLLFYLASIFPHRINNRMQLDNLLIFAPIGNPIYMNGKWPYLQKRKFAPVEK